LAAIGRETPVVMNHGRFCADAVKLLALPHPWSQGCSPGGSEGPGHLCWFFRLVCWRRASI